MVLRYIENPYLLFIMYVLLNLVELCQDNVCDENADCSDTDFGIECTCRQGFVGDGWFCRRKWISIYTWVSISFRLRSTLETIYTQVGRTGEVTA